jgi:hypothetical protein
VKQKARLFHEHTIAAVTNCFATKKKGKNHIVLLFTHAEHSIFPTASILCTQKKTKIEEEKYLPKPSVPSLMM